MKNAIAAALLLVLTSACAVGSGNGGRNRPAVPEPPRASEVRATGLADLPLVFRHCPVAESDGCIDAAVKELTEQDVPRDEARARVSAALNSLAMQKLLRAIGAPAPTFSPQPSPTPWPPERIP